MITWIESHIEESTATIFGAGTTTTFVLTNLVDTIVEAGLVAVLSGALSAAVAFYVKRFLSKRYEKTKNK